MTRPPHTDCRRDKEHEENTVSGKTWLDELHQAAESRGLSVLSPPIPKRVVIADATEAARGPGRPWS